MDIDPALQVKAHRQSGRTAQGHQNEIGERTEGEDGSKEQAHQEGQVRCLHENSSDIVLVQRITARFVREKNQIQLANTPSNNKSYYYSTVVALVPVIYVGMQSVGGAGLFEIVLLSLFEVLACFYVYKRY